MIQDLDNPLPLAVESAYGGSNALGSFVNIAKLAGLAASFFDHLRLLTSDLRSVQAGYLRGYLDNRWS